MPYYQATKSRNFGFGLTVLPYLVTYPSGPLGLVGLLTGDILGFSGGVLGPAWVFTGDCSGGDWELGGTSSSVAAGQVSLAGAGSGTDRRCLLFLWYSFPSASTMYDRGCGAGCLTTPTFWYPLSVWSRTSCCGRRGRRVLACSS